MFKTVEFHMVRMAMHYVTGKMFLRIKQILYYSKAFHCRINGVEFLNMK